MWSDFPVENKTTNLKYFNLPSWQQFGERVKPDDTPIFIHGQETGDIGLQAKYDTSSIITSTAQTYGREIAT